MSDVPIETGTGDIPQEPLTVNPSARLAEISDLRTLREQSGSSPVAEGVSPDGAPADDGADIREQAIPRGRFDEVIQQKNAAEQQAAQYATMLQQAQSLITQQQQNLNPAPGNPPGTAGPEPQLPQLPNMDDPAVVKELQTKVANGGVTELVKLVQQVVQAEAAPVVLQMQQGWQNQFAPVQQTLAQQAVDSYTQQEITRDPSFSGTEQTFRNYVSTALQRNPGLALNAETLGVIAYVARRHPQQPGLAPSLPAAAPTVPFMEQPGSAAVLQNTGQAPVRLSAEQQKAARGFNMTDAGYSDAIKRLNNG